MSQFNTLTIQQIEKLTPDSVKIAFTIPGNLKEVYTFTSGQYVTLKTTLNGEEIRRDYSICSTPQNELIEIGIKQVENGLFSQYANIELKVGDTLAVSAPHGRFTFLPENAPQTLVLFASGSGITPVLSILKTALKNTNCSVILVYGNKTPKDTMFSAELTHLKETFKNRFTLQAIYSRTQEPEALFGRIEKSTVNYILKNKLTFFNNTSFYICGPEGMINAVKNTLLEHHINENAIHFELFSASAEAETHAISANGQTAVTVIVDDEETAFSMSQEETLLEAALKHYVDAPYSCQGGICSSCIARIKEGKAEMRQNQILTDGEVAQGLILTCQAQPTTPTIVVDYDDI